MPRSDSDKSRRRSRSRRRSPVREKPKNKSRSRGRRSPAKRAAASRSRDAVRKKSRSPSRKRSPARRAARSRSAKRSRSRAGRRQGPRSRSPERVPPTDFSDYEPSPDGGGWYVYKKMGKWKYHPETGLYLHTKSKVYYIPKESDSRSFRRIEDDDDPIVKKMKQSEEMRKAIQSTEFVKFGEGEIAAKDEPVTAQEATETAHQAPGPEPKPLEPAKEDDPRREGRVNKWDSEKGFGFILSLGQEKKEKDDDEGKGIFVHRKNVVGSTATNPINLKDGCRVRFKVGEQDKRLCALEVVMLGTDGKPLPIHAGATTLEEKKKSYYVSAETIGLRVHAESWPGLKKTLQDRYVSDESMEELGVYFAVLDGHGGTQVADHAAKQLHKNIMQQFRSKQVQPASRDEKIKGAIKEAFIQTDKEILSMSERKSCQLVGSTCVSALLHGNPKLGTALRLVVANLGDSRAVLCRAGVAVAVSEDHKPARIDEKKRVERAGGLVLQIRGALRLAAPTNPNSMNKSARREYQGLAMTRSFGDMHFKQPSALAIAEPEVQVLNLSDKDLFAVLATDGIFDVMSNQEVVDMALRQWEDPEEAAKTIVRTAYKKGSEDNLTVLVIQFGWADKHVPRYLERLKQAGTAGSTTGLDIAPPGAGKKTATDDCDMFG